MYLKSIVDSILKEKGRSMSWLAEEMNKTFDGLKLSLLRGSIKYKDIVELSRILEVSPSIFFQKTLSFAGPEVPSKLEEPKENYGNTSEKLRNCQELLKVLKDQLKDKEMIISLLNNKES